MRSCEPKLLHGGSGPRASVVPPTRVEAPASGSRDEGSIPSGSTTLCSIDEMNMDGTAVVKRGKCPSCGEAVIMADAGSRAEAFDPGAVRMLVVLNFPEIDGKKRVALGPCQGDLRPLHGSGDEPVIYFGHAKHRCTER